MSERYHYFRFCRSLSVGIEESIWSRPLLKRLKPLRQDRDTCTVLHLKLEPLFGKRPNEQIIRRGWYKGLPWQILERSPGQPITEISFQTPFFHSFLATRMVLIPFLKRQLLRHSAVTLIGSAFVLRGRCYVLFGPPGSGKTRLLLEAIRQGAEFIGDTEIVLYAEGTVEALFRHLEVRLGTVQGTVYAPKIKPSGYFQLYAGEAISFLTLKRLCFNKPVLPAELGLKPVWGAERLPTELIRLVPGMKGSDRLRLEQLWPHIESYEKSYQQHYGDYFFNLQDLKASQAIWKAFSERSILKMMSPFELETHLKEQKK